MKKIYTAYYVQEKWLPHIRDEVVRSSTPSTTLVKLSETEQLNTGDYTLFYIKIMV